MSQYFVEVQTPTHGGWHHSGSNMSGDPLHITGRQYALPMNLEFAKRRVDIYRANRCKARIVHRDGAIAVDWEQPTSAAQSPVDIHNSHELVTYHNHGIELLCIFNLAIGKYFYKFRWPVANGPEQSISGISPEEIVQKLMSVPDLAGYVNTLRVDDSLPVAVAPVPTPQPTINIAVPEGFAVVGVRRGSIRS